MLLNRENIVKVLIIILFMFGLYLIDFYYGFIPKIYAADYSSLRFVLNSPTFTPEYSYNACSSTVDWDAIFNIAYYGRGLDSIYPYYILYDTPYGNGQPGLIVAKNEDDVSLLAISGDGYYNFRIQMKRNSPDTQFYWTTPSSCTTTSSSSTGYEYIRSPYMLGASTSSYSFNSEIAIYKTNIPLRLQPPFSLPSPFYHDVSINGIEYNIGDIVYGTDGQLYDPTPPPPSPDTLTWQHQYMINSYLNSNFEYRFRINNNDPKVIDIYISKNNDNGTIPQIKLDYYIETETFPIIDYEILSETTTDNEVYVYHYDISHLFDNEDYIDFLLSFRYDIPNYEETISYTLKFNTPNFTSFTGIDQTEPPQPPTNPIEQPSGDIQWWEWLYPSNWLYYVYEHVVLPIINGIKNVVVQTLQFLFVPNMAFVENAFNNIKELFNEKLPFVTQIVNMFNQLIGYDVPSSYPSDYNPLPKISLPQYNIYNKNVIDLTYYSENRQTVHNYIKYFAWFIFLIKLLKKAPKLVSKGG
jgi:hypothetical protein